MGSCFSSCMKLMGGSTTSSYEAIVDTRSDQRNFATQDKLVAPVSSSSSIQKVRTTGRSHLELLIIRGLLILDYSFSLFQVSVVNEIVSVNTQAPYAAYQPQPTKAPVNRSGFFIKYDLKEEIGVGSTSKCYRCSRKSDGQNFACKVIDKRQVEVKFTGLLDQFFVEINVSYNTYLFDFAFQNYLE